MAVVRWDRDRAIGLCDPLALDDLAGTVLVLDRITDADDALAWVGRAPCVVIGTGSGGGASSRVVDLSLTADDAASSLDELVDGIERNPHACRVLIDVLRVMPQLDVPGGLTLESLAYSTLLAGPEFESWLSVRKAPSAKQLASPAVRVERDGSQLRVTMARPENRNAFSAEMRDELFEALSVAVVDAGVREVVLCADGPTFSSGGDLTEFGTAGDLVRAHEIRTQRSVGALLAGLHARTVAHVHGSCVGAGVELPAFADHIIADVDITFRLPEIEMGLVPGAGGTVSITRRIGRQRTARLAISGQPMTAAEALRVGLVDEITRSNDRMSK